MEEIELVGRENELRLLTSFLDDMLGGQGATILMGGETGVGKTRLMNELHRIGEHKKVRVMRGRCQAESLVPLLPIKEALASGNLDHITSETEPPRVIQVHLILGDGTIVTKDALSEKDNNEHSYDGLRRVLDHLVKDDLSDPSNMEKGRIYTKDVGQYRFIIERWDYLSIVVVIEGKENEFLIDDMRNVLLNIDWEFGQALMSWDGKAEGGGGIQKVLSQITSSGKYEGVNYAKEDPQLKQENLFDNILLALKRESNIAPIMIMLDDLQWCDPTTLLLFHYLSRNIRKNNVLLLGSYRSDELLLADVGRGHPLRATMNEMSKEKLFETLNLERLKDSTILVDRILREHNLDEDFMGYVQKETGGNPLFIIELVQVLKGEKILSKNVEGLWTLSKPLEGDHLPRRIYDVIARRIAKLGKEERYILDCASVIGEEFESTILGKIMNIKRVRLYKTLHDIEKKYKLIHSHNLHYQFDHAKIREVLYKEIPEELRREYHRLIADTYANLSLEEKSEYLQTLAYHYYEAHATHAVNYAIMAGDNYTRQYANNEALRMYRMALERIEGKDVREKNLLVKLGDTSFLIGKWDDALRYHQLLIYIGESTGDGKRVAESQLRMGEIFENQNRYDEALGMLNKALEGFIRFNDSYGSAECQRVIGRLFWRKGESDEAIERYHRAVNHAKSIKNMNLLGILHDELGNAFNQKGDFSLAEKHYLESIRIMEEVENLFELARAHNNLGDLISRTDRKEEALEHFGKFIHIAKKIGNIRWQAYGYFNTGELFASLGGEGNLEKAEYNINKATEIALIIGDRYLAAGCPRIFGVINRERGSWEEAIREFELAIRMSNEINIPYYEALSHFEYGKMFEKRGDLGSAVEHVTKARALWSEIGSKEMIDEAEKELVRMGNET